jgi:hypothetical protein
MLHVPVLSLTGDTVLGPAIGSFGVRAPGAIRQMYNKSRVGSRGRFASRGCSAKAAWALFTGPRTPNKRTVALKFRPTSRGIPSLMANINQPSSWCPSTPCLPNPADTEVTSKLSVRPKVQLRHDFTVACSQLVVVDLRLGSRNLRAGEDQAAVA